MNLVIRKAKSLVRLFIRMIADSRVLYLMELEFLGEEDFSRGALTWEEADLGGLSRFKEYFSPIRWKKYRRRIEEGERCLLGRYRGRPAHWFWLADGEEYRDRGLAFTFLLAPEEGYLYDANTVKEFRGRGFYREAIGEAARLLGEKGKRILLLAVSQTNRPARAAVEKSGFKVRGEIVHRRILGRKKTRYKRLSHRKEKRR